MISTVIPPRPGDAAGSTSAAGAINVYACPFCGWRALTRHRDAGTTPTRIYCGGRHCDAATGPACHAQEVVPRLAVPTHEWYRPRSHAERGAITTTQIRDHVANGGLLLRRCRR